MTVPTQYVVWERSDGYVAATTPTVPADDRNFSFTVLLETSNWSEAHSRIRAEHVAAVMNRDKFPIADSARGNFAGVAPELR